MPLVLRLTPPPRHGRPLVLHALAALIAAAAVILLFAGAAGADVWTVTSGDDRETGDAAQCVPGSGRVASGATTPAATGDDEGPAQRTAPTPAPEVTSTTPTTTTTDPTSSTTSTTPTTADEPTIAPSRSVVAQAAPGECTLRDAVAAAAANDTIQVPGSIGTVFLDDILSIGLNGPLAIQLNGAQVLSRRALLGSGSAILVYNEVYLDGGGGRLVVDPAWGAANTAITAMNAAHLHLSALTLAGTVPAFDSSVPAGADVAATGRLDAVGVTFAGVANGAGAGDEVGVVDEIRTTGGAVHLADTTLRAGGISADGASVELDGSTALQDRDFDGHGCTAINGATFTVGADVDDVTGTCRDLAPRTQSDTTLLLDGQAAASALPELELGRHTELTAVVQPRGGPGAQTPQGTVRFYDGQTVLGDDVPLVDHGDGTARATLSLSMLATGTHDLRARYLRPGTAGDPFAGSAGPAQQVIVIGAASIGLLVTGGGGTGEDTTVHVLASYGLDSPSQAPPTGDVTLTYAGAAQTQTLDNGQTDFHIVPIATDHRVTVHYAGDAVYGPRDLTCTTTCGLPDGAETTSIAFLTPAALRVGDDGTINVPVTGEGTTPTGTVTLTFQGQTQTQPLDGSGVAPFTVRPTTTDGTVSATYSGDSGHIEGTRSSQLNVGPRPVDVALTMNPAGGLRPGDSFTLNAHAIPRVAAAGLPTPEGTITFTEPDGTEHAVSTHGGGYASITLTAPDAGDQPYGARFTEAEPRVWQGVGGLSVHVLPMANEYTVTNLGDGTATPANCPANVVADGCRLRDAVAAAATGDTIRLVSGLGTVTLEDSLRLDTAVILRLAGNTLALRLDSAGPIDDAGITYGGLAVRASVTLDGGNGTITTTGPLGPGPYPTPAIAVFNDGDLSLSRLTVSGVDRGGGPAGVMVVGPSARATVTAVTFDGRLFDVDGTPQPPSDELSVFDGGTAAVVNSTFRQGGATVTGSTLTLSGTTSFLDLAFRGAGCRTSTGAGGEMPALTTASTVTDPSGSCWPASRVGTTLTVTPTSRALETSSSGGLGTKTSTMTAVLTPDDASAGAPSTGKVVFYDRLGTATTKLASITPAPQPDGSAKAVLVYTPTTKGLHQIFARYEIAATNRWGSSITTIDDPDTTPPADWLYVIGTPTVALTPVDAGGNEVPSLVRGTVGHLKVTVSPPADAPTNDDLRAPDGSLEFDPLLEALTPTGPVVLTMSAGRVGTQALSDGTTIFAVPSDRISGSYQVRYGTAEAARPSPIYLLRDFSTITVPVTGGVNPTTTTLTTSATGLRAHDSVPLVATVVPTSGSYTGMQGSVEFVNTTSGTSLGTATLTGDAFNGGMGARLSTRVPFGSTDFEARFTPTGGVVSASTGTLTLNAAARPTTTHVTVTPAHAHAAKVDGEERAVSSEPVVVSVTVDAGDSDVAAAGAVVLTRGGGPLAAPVLDGDGTATATLTALPTGDVRLQATYVPRSDFAGSLATTGLLVGRDPVEVAADAHGRATSTETVTISGTVRATRAGSGPVLGVVRVRDGAGGPVLATTAPQPSVDGDGRQRWSAAIGALGAGRHDLVAEFTDSLDRFTQATPGTTFVDVDVPNACRRVESDSYTVPVRTADDEIDRRPVTVALSASTRACGTDGRSVRDGGSVRAVASAPALYTVTGFLVTSRDNSSAVVPASGGAATIVIDSPSTVRAVTALDVACRTLQVEHRWAGRPAPVAGLGTTTVRGRLGCDVETPRSTRELTGGETVQALDSSPLDLRTTGQSLPVVGRPAVDGDASTTLRLVGDMTADVALRLPCLAPPKLVAGTGGSAEQRSTALVSSDPRVAALGSATGACPAAWGQGLLPGTDLTYGATPVAYDKSLGAPEGDKRSAWWVGSWNQLAAPDDATSASLIADFTDGQKPQLAGEYTIDKPGDPSGRVRTFREPAATGTLDAPRRLLAVGPRFLRLACTTVDTQAVLGAKGIRTDSYWFGDREHFAVPADPKPAIKVSPAPNCGALGDGLYTIGTKVTVTAQLPNATRSIPGQGSYGILARSDTQGPTWGKTTTATARAAAARGKGATPQPVSLPAAVTAVAAAHTGIVAAERKLATAHRATTRALAAERAAKARALAGGSTAKDYTAWLAAFVSAGTTGAHEQDAATDASSARLKAFLKVDRARAVERGAAPSRDAYLLLSARERAALERRHVVDFTRRTALARELLAGTQALRARGGDGVASFDLAVERLTGLVAQSDTQTTSYRALLARQRAAAAAQERRTPASARTRLITIQRLVAAPVARTRDRGRTPTPRTGPARARAAAADPRTLREQFYDEEDTSVAAYNDGKAMTPIVFRGFGGAAFEGADSEDEPRSSQTFVVGEEKTTIKGYWTPTSCERPTIVEAQADAMATVAIDGGDDTCAQPGTVRRTANFTVRVAADGPYMPVVTVTGEDPSSTWTGPNWRSRENKRLTYTQVGTATSFPALPDARVEVELCQPIEFGGGVHDTLHAGQTLTFGAEQIDEFVARGERCAVPGFYRAGSQVQFRTPSELSDGSNASWQVDGVDQGATAPTVSLSDTQAEHAVAFDTSYACAEIVVAADPDQVVTYVDNAPLGGRARPILSTPSDCPLPYSDDSSNPGIVVGHYKVGTEVAYSWPLGAFPRDCGMDWSDGVHTVTAAVRTLTATKDEQRVVRYCTTLPPVNTHDPLGIGSALDSLGAMLNQGLHTLVDAPFATLKRATVGLFTGAAFASWDAFGDFATDVGSLASMYVIGPFGGPGVVQALHRVISEGGPAAFASPEAFGRSLAAASVTLGMTALQATLAKTTLGVGLTLSDAVLQYGANALDAAGAPSGLTQVIRMSRVATNGIAAMGTCAAGAAAGNTPPQVRTPDPSDGVGSYSSRSGAITWAKTPTAPPVIKNPLYSIEQPGLLSQVGQSFKSNLSANGKDSVVAALMQVALSSGQNLNWSPDDYANCLTYAVTGG